jgi:hypothetical protein
MWNVNCKHLIAYNSADDDFDVDDGFSGKIQYAISVKDPKFTDNKGTTGDISNNFEVDNVNRPMVSFGPGRRSLPRPCLILLPLVPTMPLVPTQIMATACAGE